MRIHLSWLLVLLATASRMSAQDTLAVARDTLAGVQDARGIAPGARIRAIAFINDCFHPERPVGSFRGIEHSAVQIHINQELGTTAIPLRAIRELSVSVGGPSRAAGARKGAVGGALAGAVVGYFFFPKTIRVRQNPVEVSDYTHALLAALVGGGFGASVGWNFPTERWQRVPLPADVVFNPECPSPQPVTR
jgi:hypothetical protein